MNLVRILLQIVSADKASLPVSFITLEISKDHCELSSSTKSISYVSYSFLIPSLSVLPILT